MVTIQHTVSDSIFVHARVAAVLVDKIKTFHSDVKITKGESSSKANSLLGIIGLSIKGGDDISFTLTGQTEKADAQELELFLKENL